MFSEQIKSLVERENLLLGKLDDLSTQALTLKSELTIIRRAKKQMDKLEGHFGGQTPISDERTDQPELV